MFADFELIGNLSDETVNLWREGGFKVRLHGAEAGDGGLVSGRGDFDDFNLSDGFNDRFGLRRFLALFELFKEDKA